MHHDYPHPDQSPWRLALHESLAILGAALLYPFGVRRRVIAPTPRARRQRTVVLVHGYLCNPSIFLPMQAYLRYQGIRPILPYRYASTHGVERGAIGLKRFLGEHVRGGEIDLVCHSLGGLVARTYLQELGGTRRVQRCITLGTPHQGTYNAYWLANKVGREMRPNSPLLRRLHDTRELTRDIDFLSVIGGSDQLVIPRIAARHERELLVPNMGHVAMMFSPTVWQLIAAHLTQDEGLMEEAFESGGIDPGLMMPA